MLVKDDGKVLAENELSPRTLETVKSEEFMRCDKKFAAAKENAAHRVSMSGKELKKSGMVPVNCELWRNLQNQNNKDTDNNPILVWRHWRKSRKRRTTF